MKENWNPNSWQNKKALHQPIYEDQGKLKKVSNKMKESIVFTIMLKNNTNSVNDNTRI